jgi:hypothetical protein
MVKMKSIKLISWLALVVSFALCMNAQPAAFSASEKIIDVTAEIPANSPQISVTILKFTDGNPDNNPWTNSQEVNSMDFGLFTNLLTDNSNAGIFFSPVGHCVVIFAESFGKPYNIMSSCLGITSGANSLKPGSFGLTPVYSEADKFIFPGGSSLNGPFPGNGANLGTPGPAVGDRMIYSSENGVATPRILQAYYGFPPFLAGGGDPFPGFTPIQLTQAPGQYSGTVTITIALK